MNGRSGGVAAASQGAESATSCVSHWSDTQDRPCQQPASSTGSVGVSVEGTRGVSAGNGRSGVGVDERSTEGTKSPESCVSSWGQVGRADEGGRRGVSGLERRGRARSGEEVGGGQVVGEAESSNRVKHAEVSVGSTCNSGTASATLAVETEPLSRRHQPLMTSREQPQQQQPQQQQQQPQQQQ